MIHIPQKLQNLWHSRSGANAVEFAIVSPVFFLMVFGVIEYCRLLWVSHALHETAIATARCMAIPQLECEDGSIYSISKVKTFAENRAAGWSISIEPASITLDRDGSCHGLEGRSRVEITHQFITVVPLLLTALTDGTNLKAEGCYQNQ